MPNLKLFARRFILQGRCIAALLAVLLPSLTLAEPSFVSPQQFGNWVAYYYTSPEPDRIVPSIVYYATSKLFDDPPASRVPMAYFYAALLHSDPLRANLLFEAAAKEDSLAFKHYALQIIWLANNAASQSLLKKARAQWDLSEEDKRVIDKKISAKPPLILSMPVRSPESLDILWAAFSATGDADAVRKIASTVHLAKDGQGEQLILGAAAKWSLTSQAAQHPPVLKILEDEAAKSRDTQAEVLKEILINARDAKLGKGKMP